MLIELLDVGVVAGAALPVVASVTFPQIEDSRRCSPGLPTNVSWKLFGTEIERGS